MCGIEHKSRALGGKGKGKPCPDNGPTMIIVCYNNQKLIIFV